MRALSFYGSQPGPHTGCVASTPDRAKLSRAAQPAHGASPADASTALVHRLASPCPHPQRPEGIQTRSVTAGKGSSETETATKEGLDYPSFILRKAKRLASQNLQKFQSNLLKLKHILTQIIVIPLFQIDRRLSLIKNRQESMV